MDAIRKSSKKHKMIDQLTSIEFMAARNAFKISSLLRMRRSGKGGGVVLDASNQGMATCGYASEQLTDRLSKGPAETPY